MRLPGRSIPTGFDDRCRIGILLFCVFLSTHFFNNSRPFEQQLEPNNQLQNGQNFIFLSSSVYHIPNIGNMVLGV